LAITTGVKFEPPYIGSYNQGVHGEGHIARGALCSRSAR